jgi:hypothetical protein
MTQPLVWLGPGEVQVDVLINLGHQAITAGLVHVCTDWGTTSFKGDHFRHLIPQHHLWPSPINDRVPPAPLSPESLLLPLLEPEARPAPFMTRFELVGWWIEQVFPHEANPSRLSEVLDRPDSRIVVGTHHLRTTFELLSEDCAQLGACLSMIGAGALEMLFAQQCELCKHRWAIYGLRCRACSRSKQAIDVSHSNEAAVRARRARSIRDTITSLVGDLSDDQRGSLARSVAGVLYAMPNTSAVYQHWLDSIKQALKQAPLVESGLPNDFLTLDFTRQLKELRKLLDPSEFDYSIWPVKIAWSQAWLEQEADIQARRRGPGPMPKTVTKATQALALLNSGLSKAEVARVLGVSPSHLSHILARTQSMPPK